MKFYTKFIIFSFLIGTCFYLFVLSVDPYDKYGFNFWNLKTKAVNSHRDNKFHQINNTKKHYNLFIIGSSRVQAFDPDILEKEIHLKTFNYGVNNSKPEDLLAITKHIIAKQKPKIIFLQTDFYNLNKHIPMDGRLNSSPLKAYLEGTVTKNINNKKFYYFEKTYITLSSLKDSIKLVYKNKLGHVEITHKKNGMKLGYKPVRDPELAETYFKNEYKTYEFDSNRINYFKKLKHICDSNNIELIVSISPMNKDHFLKLVSDKYLLEKLLAFKRIVVNIFGTVHDFNNISTFNYNYPYWSNSVHPSIELPKLMSSVIFHKYGYSYKNVPKDFGVLLTKQNIEQQLESLKQQIKNYDLNKTLK